MPVARSLLEDLQRRYGSAEGERVYYAMEGAGTGPFSPGGKYRHLHEAFAEKHGLAPSQAIRTKVKAVRSGTKRAKPAKRGRR